MAKQGLDFKHKEVINIKDAKRLRFCARRNGKLGNWYNNVYHRAW